MHHIELARAKMDFASTVNQIGHCLICTRSPIKFDVNIPLTQLLSASKYCQLMRSFYVEYVSDFQFKNQIQHGCIQQCREDEPDLELFSSNGTHDTKCDALKLYYLLLWGTAVFSLLLQRKQKRGCIGKNLLFSHRIMLMQYNYSAELISLEELVACIRWKVKQFGHFLKWWFASCKKMTSNVEVIVSYNF